MLDYRENIATRMFFIYWTIFISYNILGVISISMRIIAGQILYYYAWLYALILFLLHLLKNDWPESNEANNSRFFVVIFIIIIFSAIVTGNSDQTFDDNTGNIYTFLSLLVFISCENLVVINKKTLKTLYWLNFIFCCSLILLSRSELAYAIDKSSLGLYARDYNYLTLGFANPNSAAMILVSCFAILLLMIKTSKRSFLLYPFLVYLYFLIYLTGSRTSFFVATGLFIVVLLLGKIKLNPKYFIVFGVCVVPIAFTFILTYMYDNDIYRNMEIFGKSIYSGREKLFSEIMSGTGDLVNVIFGDLKKYPFTNCHNGPLSIYAATGIFGLITYYWFLMGKLVGRCKIIEYNTARFALIALALIYANSMAEAVFIIGGSTFTLMIFTLHILTRAKIDMIYKEEEHEQ